MTRRTTLPRLLPTLLVTLALALGVSQLMADASGRTGRAQSTTGCSCHGTTRTAGVTVTLTGPQQVLPSSTHSYTLTVTGGPATTFGGYNLKASAGTLAAGANSRLSGGELTHNNDGVRSWTFNWTAPAATGTSNFYAVGLATDGSGDEGGDDWNWYGGAVNTPFAISVTTQTGVGDEAPVTWLAPATPNPLVTRARVAFSLARAGTASLEAFDAAGRRVSTLARGVMPAGPQSVSWSGVDESGSPLPGGVYFLRLHTEDRELTTRVLVLR